MTADTFGELRSVLALAPTPDNIKALRTIISDAVRAASPLGTFKQMDTWCHASPMFNYIVHHFAHSSEWRRAYPWVIGTRPSDVKTARVILTEHDLHSGTQKYSAVFGECILGASESYRGLDRAGFATSLIGAEVGQVWQGVYSERGADVLLWAHTAPLILAMDPQAEGLVQLIGEQIAICAAHKVGRLRGEQAQESWEHIEAALDVYEEMKTIGLREILLISPGDPMPHPPPEWMPPVMRTIAARAGSIHGLILAAWCKAQIEHPTMFRAQRRLELSRQIGDALPIVTHKAVDMCGAAAIADIHDAIGTIWVHHWQDALAA